MKFLKVVVSFLNLNNHKTSQSCIEFVEKAEEVQHQAAFFTTLHFVAYNLQHNMHRLNKNA